MIYYFYDSDGIQQLYKDLQECIRDAKKDGTCTKVRDTEGGEYWFQSNQNPDDFKSIYSPY